MHTNRGHIRYSIKRLVLNVNAIAQATAPSGNWN